MSSYTSRFAAIVAAVALASTVSAAQAVRPLPDADLVVPPGGLTKLTALGQEGQWLILYLGENSPPSARLLEALAGWELGPQLARVVVVVRGTDAQPLAEEWTARLPGVRWASDPSGSIARGAGLRGTPTVIGARSAGIGFILAGVLNDPSMIRDVVTGWLR